MISESITNDWNPYYLATLREIHQIILWGYEGARAKITPDVEEPVITQYIVEAMNDKLQDINTSDHFDLYEPHENMPVHSEGREGKNRPLPDIVIRCKGKRPWFNFYIEAKRLKSNGFPIGEYIGQDGLQCYLRGDYANQQKIAAMIAYIQSDTPRAWYDKLNYRFKHDNDGKLAVAVMLAPISIISELEHEWLSEHNRHDNSPIKIFHIFLECCSRI